MKRVIFLFLDGVGLGADDPTVNPLAAGIYPTLAELLDGERLVSVNGPVSGSQAELVPTDACMGVPGRPQSATGQAAILTGINVPERLGEHYGPRPDARVRDVLDEGNLFRRLREAGYEPYFCNAYPPTYFASVARGKRLLSAVPYAASSGGQRLLEYDDIVAKRAIAADFTNQGWRDRLGYDDVPVFSPADGGRMLWELAKPYQFVFFEHWLSDVLGHRRQLPAAIANFEMFDAFLGGLLDAVDLTETLIIVGSDHGNVEDCSHGKHTQNPSVTLVMGKGRTGVAAQIEKLTDYSPVVLEYLAS